MSSINFKAQYINPVTLKKKNEEGQYCDVQGAFVKIDPKDKKDMRALEYVIKDWGGSALAKNIYNTASNRSSLYKSNKKHKFYAVTEQKQSWQDLDSHKVLGLAYFLETSKGNGALEYIVVKPNNAYASEDREYKNVGKSMLDSIKKTSSLQAIELYSLPEAENFYKKNDFTSDGSIAEHMYWHA